MLPIRISPQSMRILIAALSIGALPLSAQAQNQERGAAAEKPNIVLVFIDDAGYADFGFQGSEDFRTPRLDQLASQGVRFTNAYVAAPACGHSRAALITGRYPQTFGYVWNNVPGSMDQASKLLGDEMGLPPQQITIAEALSEHGYRSMAVGKWHLGIADRYHPLKQGFDHFYGFRGGARSYFPYEDPENRPDRRIEKDFENYQEPDQYMTDALADGAARFIEENSDQPFFLYFSPNAVHGPMHATEEDLQRFPELQGKRRKLAAMTWALDRAVGRIIDQLEQSGVRERTLIVFTNDNGGPPHNSSSNAPFSGAKGTLYEGGIRMPWLMHWPGQWEGGGTDDAVVSTLDLLPTFLQAAGGNPAAHDRLDGLALQNYLDQPASSRAERTLYWREGPVFAIRQGAMKMIDHPDQPAELFDLEADPGETQSLHWERPEMVRDFYRQLYEWRKTHQRPLWMFEPKYDHKGVSLGHEQRRVKP